MKKNLANETIKAAIKDMTNELKLKQRPKVVFETVDEDFVMAATGTVSYTTRNWFDKIITKTECDYVLHINKKAVNNMISMYCMMFGNKQASYDGLYLLVCHELRHMWQYQEQFQVGDKFDSLHTTLSELSEGHGASRVEKDANEWMLLIAKRKGWEELGHFMEMSQRSMGLYNQVDTEFNKTMRQHGVNAMKNYNRYLHFVYKTLLM